MKKNNLEEILYKNRKQLDLLIEEHLLEYRKAFEDYYPYKILPYPSPYLKDLAVFVKKLKEVLEGGEKK